MAPKPSKGEYIETVSLPHIARLLTTLHKMKSFFPSFLSTIYFIVQINKQPVIKDTGNKVSRKSLILGSQNIILGGKVYLAPFVFLPPFSPLPLPNSNSKSLFGLSTPSYICFDEKISVDRK